MTRFLDDRLRCALCGDVIGVYEPLVVRDDAGLRETSIAREPTVPALCDEGFHRGCFADRQSFSSPRSSA